jgi:low affinity Fe/Cu permease
VETSEKSRFPPGIHVASRSKAAVSRVKTYWHVALVDTRDQPNSSGTQQHWFLSTSNNPGVDSMPTKNAATAERTTKSQSRTKREQQDAGTRTSPASALSEAKTAVAKSDNISLRFSRFATRAAQIVGHPYTFLAAAILLVLWACSGPVFHYSDTWQLIINTSTTIITFLVVFLIQNTQNRDAKAIHLKLDELIRSHQPARNEMIDIEKLSDEELEQLEKKYAKVCEERRRARDSKVKVA